jgi:hypothetical protein
VGGAAAGEPVRQLLNSSDAAVRAAAAETCAHAIFDEPTTAALGARLTDPSDQVRNAAVRALAMYAQWRSPAAQAALIAQAAAGNIAAVDALGQAVKYQVHGVRQDPPIFQTLVSLLNHNNEEVRVMAANILAPIRDPGFRGDAGRPENKAPNGGWQAWLDEIAAKQAGYRKDYDACGNASGDAAAAYCKGGSYLLGYDPRTRQTVPVQPAEAFRYTLQAAELGYVPAQAALGMMYAIGKGVEQNPPEAAKWWKKAADAGHPLAAVNYAMAPKGR